MLIDAETQSGLVNALSELSAFSGACSGHSEEEVRLLLEVEPFYPALVSIVINTVLVAA